LPKVAGVIGGARSKPCGPSLSFASCDAKIRLSSALSFATTSGGVPAGATKPNQVLTS
jgi:hypothetical protein